MSMDTREERRRRARAEAAAGKEPSAKAEPTASDAQRAAGRGRWTAAALLDLLAQEPAPAGWHELLALTHSFDPRARKQLAQLVKGMLRNGELMQDKNGHYHPAASEGDVAVLEGSGRNLTFAGVPVERGRGFKLRPGDRVEGAVADGRAQVLRVVEYSAQPVIGELRYHGRFPHVESVSPEYRGRVSLEAPPEVGADGNIVAVRVTGEDRHGLVGVVTAVVSAKSGVAHAAETLLTSHRVPREWPPEVLRAAERLPRQVQPARHRERRSLVDLPLVTIDGDTAKDFDDAVYAERHRGGWRLLVAIADVAHYVKPGSPLDLSAWERGNSLYLPDRVTPMLPEALSNGLCSLKPQEPRLALVCDMRVTAQGNVTKFEFYEALMLSWQRLTYTRAQEFLEAGVLDVEPEVLHSLRELKAVYQALRGAREQRGALDFDTHETELELENGHIKAIHPVTRLDAHRLIEEAMISANVCAARFLEGAEQPALYRVHEQPDAEKTEQLRQALALAGIRLARGDLTPKLVHDALAQLGDRPDRWIFEMMTLRSMNQAIYSPDNKGHYGLALPRYMHFTSPIRRYADLVVHRAIKAVLNGVDAELGDDWLAVTGAHISSTERRADEVSWGVEGWLKCEYVAERIGEEFDGVVMGVAEFGLFVDLRGYYVQGLVHISALGQDYFRYNQSSQMLVGDRSGRRFGLGDALRVKLVDVQPAVGKIDLDLVSTKSAKSAHGDTSGQSGGARKSRRRRRGSDA
jgi:ribonuclease R